MTGGRRKKKVEKKDKDKIETPSINCDICGKNVTNQVRIRCAECDDLDICVPCFSRGAEVENHSKHHSYRVMDRLNYPLLETSWTAAEELLLLEGIDTYGLGNWEDIAEHIGTKTALLCMAHYEITYLDRPNHMPDASIMESDSWAKWAALHPDSHAAKLVASGVSPHTKRTEADYKKPEPSNPKKNEQKISTPAETAGYLPLRADFDTEHNTDAEVDVQDLVFTDADDPLDREVKTTLLEIYADELEVRKERKAFVFDRNIIDPKQSTIERRRLKDEKDLHKNMQMFARFHTKEQHEQLMDGLVAELQIRKQIATLQHYRAIGITSLDTRVDGNKRKRDEPKSSRSARYANRVGDDEEDVITNEAGPVFLNGAAGVDLLSLKERELCSILALWPQQYLMIKSALLKEYCKTGSLHRTAAMQLLKIDATKTAKIYDYFVKNEWVSYVPPEQPTTSTPKSSGFNPANVPLTPIGMSNV